MNSLDDLAELHMSGARAVFKLEGGAKLEQSEIADAFEDQGMQLESFEELRRPRAAAVYVVDAGIT